MPTPDDGPRGPSRASGPSMIAHSSSPRPDDRQHRPDRIGPLRGRVLRVRHQSSGTDQRDHGDGDVDEEDRPPPEAARAGGRRRSVRWRSRARRCPAQAPMARARSSGSRNDVVDDGQRRRDRQGRADAHDGPAGDQQVHRAREGGTDRSGREHREPDAGRTVLRPKRSARLPPTNNSPAKAIAYQSTIHCSSLDEACRSRTSVGRATLRMVLSTLTMSAARHTTTRAAHRRRSGPTSGATAVRVSGVT